MGAFYVSEVSEAVCYGLLILSSAGLLRFIERAYGILLSNLQLIDSSHLKIVDLTI